MATPPAVYRVAGEEARDPRRTIRPAVLGATLGIGILYIFTTYAVAVAVGPDKFATFTSSGDVSWEGLARQLYGLFWVLVFLAIVAIAIANANAGVNVSSRTAYAMGRIGVFRTGWLASRSATDVNGGQPGDLSLMHRRRPSSRPDECVDRSNAQADRAGGACLSIVDTGGVRDNHPCP